MKKINLKKIAPTHNYRISELAKATNLTPRAIYYKIKDHLPVLFIETSLYISGMDFIEYEKLKREERKVKDNGNKSDKSMYCFRCRDFREPKDNIVKVSFAPRTHQGSIVLNGICPICGSKINKISNESKLKEIKKLYKIS